MRYLSILVLVLLAGCDGPSDHLALGTLERDRIAHVATASEVVVALPVLPGTQVERGTLLVQLDDSLQTAERDKAAAQVELAKAALAKLRHGARVEELAAARARVTGEQAALRQATQSWLRIVNLNQRGITTRSELDKARAARDAQQAALDSAQEALLVLTNGAREEDLRAAEATLNAARASLARETDRLADLAVRATRDGLLDNLPWNLGERVTKGSPVAIVLAGKAPFARVYVPEPYRVKLKVGDSLTLHVDGLDEPLKGRLRWIATRPAWTPYYALNQKERALLMYLAEVQLPDRYADLPIGIPVQVELP